MDKRLVSEDLLSETDSEKKNRKKELGNPAEGTRSMLLRLTVRTVKRRSILKMRNMRKTKPRAAYDLRSEKVVKENIESSWRKRRHDTDDESSCSGGVRKNMFHLLMTMIVIALCFKF
ncbi:pre-mRNA-splicing factor CWC21 [Iris pallida]|uniref:Pre-mRNA-splicing factor CWC21 n=1 Tax=Iris pallida TaxID=29817 RepID=A0AAX6GFB9_IRIPA|nr:pre-mRNA-splicing factor CWC21 [Iris pallida]